MDIYKFINSIDIADYLKKIEYNFTSLECAFLIYQSKKTTLQEKHVAWHEIIETMPDCIITVSKGKTQNLHLYLSDLIALQNELIDSFYKTNDNSIYSFRVCCNGDKSWCENFDNIFPDYNSCKNWFEEKYKSDEEFEFDIKAIEIKKQWLSAPKKYLKLTMNKDRNIIDIEGQMLHSTNKNEDLLDTLSWLYFDFPTPFKKGDILFSPYIPFTCDYRFMVLTDLCTWQRKRPKLSGDNTDMSACGYYVCDNGNIYYEYMFSYLDMEYVKKELTGISRILIPLSNFVKGKIDIELFNTVHKFILLETELEISKSMLYNFDKKSLELIGVHLEK